MTFLSSHKISSNGESGMVSVLFILMAAILMIFAAFAVDMGLANIAKTQQTDKSAEVISEVMHPATAGIVKSSDTPSSDLSIAVIKNLRQNGYQGAISVYFYEPTQGESGLAQNKRLYVFCVQLNDNVNTIFGKIIGTNTIPVSTIDWASAMPYSEIKVYRPNSSANGVWFINANQDENTLSFKSMSINDMPDGKAHLDDALKKAKG